MHKKDQIVKLIGRASHTCRLKVTHKDEGTKATSVGNGLLTHLPDEELTHITHVGWRWRKGWLPCSICNKYKCYKVNSLGRKRAYASHTCCLKVTHKVIQQCYRCGNTVLCPEIWHIQHRCCDYDAFGKANILWSNENDRSAWISANSFRLLAY